MLLELNMVGDRIRDDTGGVWVEYKLGLWARWGAIMHSIEIDRLRIKADTYRFNQAMLRKEAGLAEIEKSLRIGQ
jgi:hypothetical protein